MSTIYDPTVNLRPSSPPEDLRDDMDPEQRNFVIAVPKYHENLYRHVQKNLEWLKESSNHSKKSGVHYRKKVKTPEDLKILNNLITALRTEKSELFIDFTFHAKPKKMSTREYVSEFLRFKGIFSYYTFMGWYRITVYPESGIEDCPFDQRREYLLIPLLIRLKKNKVFDQFKSISYTNASGTEYEIHNVNPLHFLRDEDPRSREQEDKLNQNKQYRDSIFLKES